LTVPEQSSDDLEGLHKPINLVPEGVAECVVLGFVATRAEAENEAATAQLVKGVGHFGDESRVAEAGGNN
jgi:hypothetical protein